MNIRDWFGLAVRIFGLWLVCRSLPYLSSFVDVKLYPSSDKAQAGAAAMLIYAILDLTLAAVFLLWTRAVVSWSYGDEVAAPGDGAVEAAPRLG